MVKTSPTEVDNRDHFMQAMARVLGITRRKINKIMFQGQQSPYPSGSRRSSVRDNGSPSKFVAK
jgi:hypothetical protein